MGNAVDPGEPGVVPVADVAGDDLEAVTVLGGQRLDRPVAEKEAVQDADPVAALEQPAADFQTDITAAAGHQDVHCASLSLWKPVELSPWPPVS